jgi:predicted P-loop ATPase
MSTAITSLISFYKRVSGNAKGEVPKPVEDVPLDIFLENIRTGKWEDIVHSIRIIEDEKQRSEAKRRVPYVTISGTFSERTDEAIIKHSGYISIDIDDVKDTDDFKRKLEGDPYIAAMFVSISGRGLCLLFRINPDKHREAFQGIGEYLFTQYNIICDPTSINVSRARFVSYDPYLYSNSKAIKFTQYPKNKPPKKIEKVIFDKGDFGNVLNQIIEKRLNLTEDYHDWIRIGFAISHKFGEQGREYFHILSQYSSKYDSRVCDKQYDVILKRRGHVREATIATFYYYIKNAGIQIYSDRTRTIAYSAAQGKKSGLKVQQIAENLNKFEGITDAEDIINQVIENDIELNEDSLIVQLELWLRQNYNLQRNEITRYIESNGNMVIQSDFNSIFIKAKKMFDKVTYEMIDRLINSDFVPSYNPFLQFFADIALNAQKHPKIDLKNGVHLQPLVVVELIKEHFPLITQLFNTIHTKDSNYCLYFGAKWLVGTISAIHGRHSPLMFVLSGAEQNTGKTEWFRRLLPKELHEENRTYPDYYAESKLDAGKDDEILMTQKLLIMDDEMGGKSKKEDKRLKELTSKQTFSLREPYGRNNVDLQRISVLCGTTNENEILSDPTGNRRIIPIYVHSIDQETYNKIDKTALWTEVYELYQCGLRWRLDRVDIEYLGQDKAFFEVSVSESELLSKYFEPGGDVQMTATDVKVYIENKTNQRLSLDRIGKELKRLKFEQKHIKLSNGGTKRVYLVKELIIVPNINKEAVPPEDLPF